LGKRLDSASRAAVVPAAKVCTTEICKEFSKYMLQSLVANYSAVDPCVDFEKWSCDGWREAHTYRPEQSRLSVSSVMSDTISDLLHAIMEGPYAENTTFAGQSRELDKQNFKKMQTAYRTCMNEDTIKSYGVAPLRNILEELEKVYPVKVPAAQGVDDELTNTLIWLAKRGISALVSTSTGVSCPNRLAVAILTNFKPDDMNPDTIIIAAGSSEVQLAKKFYNKSIVLTNYTRAVAQTLHVLDTGKPIDDDPIPSSKNATLFAKAQRIVDFERLISDNTPEPEVASKIEVWHVQ
jgi:endothelin-converting enzyme